MMVFVRYSVIGILTNISGYLLYLLLTWIGAGPKTTMTTLYLTGAAIGFFGNRRFTFSYQGNVVQSIKKYTIAHIIGYLINFVMLYCFVDIYGYPHQVVQGIAIIIVAIYLFVVFKYFVFPQDIIQRDIS